MKVISKTNCSTGKAQILREARIKAKAKTKENSSSKTSGESILSAIKSGTTTNKTELGKNYSAIKTSADSLQAHASKLLATGENSLFGKAISSKVNSTGNTDASANQTTTSSGDSTESKATESKDNVVKEIMSFVQDYNTMVGKLRNVGGTVNNQYLAQMKKNFTQSKSALEALGLKQTSSGTLSANKKILNAADTKKIQAVFGSKNSFTEKTSQVSQKVETYANVRLTALNKCSDSSSYTQSGTSSSNGSSSGSLYNKLG